MDIQRQPESIYCTSVADFVLRQRAPLTEIRAKQLLRLRKETDRGGGRPRCSQLSLGLLHQSQCHATLIYSRSLTTVFTSSVSLHRCRFNHQYYTRRQNSECDGDAIARCLSMFYCYLSRVAEKALHTVIQSINQSIKFYCRQ